jgi:hypothetical protein
VRTQKILVTLFKAGTELTAWLTRSRLAWLEARVTNPFFVKLTQVIRGPAVVEPTAEALGREWERLLPSKKAAHIVAHDARTAFGEITIECPLRGTGDVHACHRMMAYDRKLLGAVGGQLVVLRSQAEPGVTTCQVAIRRAGEDVSDLVPAHIRVGK